MRDKEVIERFIEYLNNSYGKALKIERWPDEENRASPDIDAIAGEYAIEHTRFDTVENQTRDSDYFMKVVQGLEEEFYGKLDYQLDIIFPYDAVRRGQDWSNIKESIRKWIINESCLLSDGTTWIEDIQGIPFKLYINIDRDPDIIRRLFFSRFQPREHSEATRLKGQLNRKIQKLNKYKRQNYITLLLIESDDIALMNKLKFVEWVKNAFPVYPEGVDDFWYVETSSSSIDFENIKSYYL